MALAQKELQESDDKKTDGTLSDETPREQMKGRESKELVIAFSGPIGSGVGNVKNSLSNILKGAGYVVEVIKVSEYLKSVLEDNKLEIEYDEIYESGAERYFQMQDAGNKLRESHPDILAEYAIQKILHTRTGKLPEDQSVLRELPPRTVYIIDQLKHPNEVSLLRTVYGNLFYLIGVLSPSSKREARLESENIDKEKIAKLMERDRKEHSDFGQQLDKSLQLADFFIRNDHVNVEGVEQQLKRFIELIHNANGISPTKEEYGMYIAYASGLRSACLSRVVGAAIMDSHGRIISTGRNDVPKGGGGLYGPENGPQDQRCVKIGDRICHNNLHKNKLKKEIERILADKVSDIENIPLDFAKTTAQQIHHETRAGDLIEFSRSIHAEMDAITSLARLGGGSTQDTTMFTYTFPCHNCARHIVAAGIKTVYYLEPYEKSLAKELHSDSIDLDASDIDESGSNKVKFMHFEGVAPRQYLNIFNLDEDRKDANGAAIFKNTIVSDKKVPEYLDNYREYEVKVFQHFNKDQPESKS